MPDLQLLIWYVRGSEEDAGGKLAIKATVELYAATWSKWAILLISRTPVEERIFKCPQDIIKTLSYL